MERSPSACQSDAYSSATSVFRRVWRPFDADLPQVAEGGLDGAGGAARGVKDLDLGAGDGGAVGEGPRAPGQRGEPPLGGRGVAAQVLAFGAIELEGEGELVAFLPAVLGQEGATGGEVGERGGIGRGFLGPLPRRQIDLGHALALLGRGDQGRPVVQLGRDLERPLAALGGRRSRPQSSANLEVQPRPVALGNQRVGGLLHAVVREATGMVDPEHQVLLDRRVEHRFGIAPQHVRHRSAVDDAPDVGGQRQGLLRLTGQLAELGHHQIRDVVGRALGADARHVPGPAAGGTIEGDQPLRIQRRQEVNGEERIAAGLLAHQSRQGGGLRRRAMDGVGDEPVHRARGQRPDGDLPHDGAAARGACRGSPPRGCAAGTSSVREAPMSSTCRVSGSVARSATRFELAASTHCRSSRKRVRGCSGRAKAQANWRTTMRSRFSASPSGNSGGSGWGPGR